MYFQLHGILQQSSENKSAHKKSCYLSSPKNKKKDKENKKPKQVKALAFLCANKQTKTNEQGKVWVPISYRFT